MRAAATVVRLMPSPRNTITFLARPDMAPLAAACAAPLRYHQAGVSPAGRSIAGTSTDTGASAGAVAAPVVAGVAQAVARAAHSVGRNRRDGRIIRQGSDVETRNYDGRPMSRR